MKNGYTYFAFISYKHEDQHWTRWLKRRLQAYRLPVRTRREHSDLPKRLIPIFYDSNLRPGILDTQVRSEVQSSRFLIVVCSREAQRNPKWINKEIDFFLENGGDRSRIIPVIVEKTEHPVAETFPSRLAELNAEQTILGVNIPLEGKRTAILKIVSAMQGIRIEELESEDRKRRRKDMILAAACVALAVAAAVYGVSSYRAVSRARAAEEAGKLLEMSGSAMDIDRREAVRYALEALEKHPEEEGKQKAEYALADALGIYSTDVFVPAGRIETDDYVRGILLAEDGSVAIVDHGDSLTAYSTERKSELWQAKAVPVGIAGGKLYLEQNGTVWEADPRTGETLRTVTDAQEAQEVSFQDNNRRLSPDGQLRIAEGGKMFLIEGSPEEIRIPLASDYFDAAFIDDRQVLYMDRTGIMIYSLETGDTKILFAFEEEGGRFQYPVRILSGKEKSLCILNGEVYCVSHTGEPGIKYTFGTLHDQRNGILTAFWLDEEEKYAMWVGYDGRASVAGSSEFTCVGPARETANRHWTLAGTSSDKPEWLAFKAEDDAFALYLYRKNVNPDALLMAESIPEAFQYETVHGGKYIFRRNTYNPESVWFDLARTETGEVVWTDRDDLPAFAQDRYFYDYGLDGISPDLSTLYSYQYGAISLSDGTVVSPEDCFAPKSTEAVQSRILPSDGTRPTVHVRLYCPADAPPEIVVYEELEEKWRTKLPMEAFKGDLPWDALSYALSYSPGENGWTVLFCSKDGDIHLPVLIDLFGHRTAVCEEITGYLDGQNDYRFGSEREEPVMTEVADGKIRVVSCTDGQVIRTFDSPAENEDIMVYPVMGDRYLLVHTTATNTLYFLDSRTGETAYRYKSTIEPFNGMYLSCAWDERYFWFVLHDRLEGDIQDGYRLDTETWTIDRHFPKADTFLPAQNRVICMDDSEVRRWCYPVYTREELAERAREYLAAKE